MKNREKLYKITSEIQKEIIAHKLFSDISNCHPQMIEPFDWLHWEMLPTINDQVKLNLLHESFQFLDSPNITNALNRNKNLKNLRNLLQNWDKTYSLGNEETKKSERVSRKRVSVSEETLLKDFHTRNFDERELDDLRTLLSISREQKFVKASSEIVLVLADLAEKRFELNMKFSKESKNVGQWLRLNAICEAILSAEPKHERALKLRMESEQRNK